MSWTESSAPVTANGPCAIWERNSNWLREVRAALRRIDAGTFGICVGCDENINPKRLAAVPWASSCIVCQEAADQRQSMPQSVIDTALNMAA
jgi:RNA polymerase-binding transcription factor DksA